MDGIYHDKWEKSSEPKWLNNPRCHMGPMYTNYAAFNTALQNPGGGDPKFWQEVPNYDYAVKNMKRKNPDIQAKFDSKNKHTGVLRSKLMYWIMLSLLRSVHLRHPVLETMLTSLSTRTRFGANGS